MAPERAKYYFVPQIDTKIKVSGCRSVSVYEGMELFIVSRMKREMPLYYTGPDGSSIRCISSTMKTWMREAR